LRPIWRARRKRSISSCARSKSAGYKPGDDVVLALDCAATEFFKGGVYDFEGEGVKRDPGAMADYLADLCARYPIISVEDGMAEDDFEGWKILTDKIGSKIQLVGDDLFVTNPARHARRQSRAAWRTRCWSRSTRSARCPRRSKP